MVLTMARAQHSSTSPSLNATLRTGPHPRVRWAVAVATLAGVFAIAGCTVPPVTDGASPGPAAEVDAPETEPSSEPAEAAQEETCDWDAPKLSGTAGAPEGQEGNLDEVIVGSWQHTHTSEGGGFEAVTNDHRYVFPSPGRMLYCQHVPGATDHAENAADVTLNGTEIELPGGKYGYTVTAWDADTMLWDNPVGGGYVYLLQRR